MRVLLAFFRAIPSVTSSTTSTEYRGTIIYHRRRTSFIVVRQQRASSNLLLGYKWVDGRQMTSKFTDNFSLPLHSQNIPFVFVDVGGQRTQRQKWTKCFDGSVTSILFLVSTSEFDQVLAEDRWVFFCQIFKNSSTISQTFSRTNRLEESKNIFDTIVNNTAFQSISVILFLNKSDLLALKVKNPETDIRWYYPQYTGNPHSIIDVQTFILQMFLRVRRNNSHHLQSLKPPQPIYHHFTTAVDTQNIQVVFNSVKDTILQRNLASLMLQWEEKRVRSSIQQRPFHRRQSSSTS